MELLIIILGLILDRVTKLWALKELSNTSGIVVIKDFFGLFYFRKQRSCLWYFAK
ncbi:lipoprotein signal peptidase [Clostridium carboxidivorans P7]|uniref:Lipoprotein signal peptidase n=1 Tax=Clostridium carboxidivorans P7 TaxID=536227 RepID=C6Q1P5_9CLOT|nr:lipoprotein signal peptidase [Clostridium carboxidivorans P7]